MIFVAAHAVDVVVMHHAHEGQVAVHEGLDHREIGHFVNVNGVGLESGDGGTSLGGGVIGEWKARAEYTIPDVFVFAGARAVEDGGVMTMCAELLCCDGDICLGTAECAEALVDVEDFHEVRVVERRWVSSWRSEGSAVAKPCLICATNEGCSARLLDLARCSRSRQSV